MQVLFWDSFILDSKTVLLKLGNLPSLRKIRSTCTQSFDDKFLILYSIDLKQKQI